MGKLIGIFATEISSRVQSNLYQKLHEKAKGMGYNLAFFSANLERLNSADTDESAYYLFEIAENMDFSAFIIHAQSLRKKSLIDKIIKLGRKKNIPIFLYDCDTLGYTKDQDVITINLDYKQGFAEGVKHILEHHGCKDVYMLAGVKGNGFSEDRIEVYKQEMAFHGLSVSEDRIMYGDFWELPAMEAVNKLLDGGVKPEAICCANDSMAVAAIKALVQRGYSVPQDVIVTGFDGIEDGKYNFPPIATCEPLLDCVPDFIFKAIDEDQRIGEFLVPLKFYPKESCGCENTDKIDDRKELARLMENIRQNSWQHSMLSNMQLDLMDSCDMFDISIYMSGIIGMFKGFSHLYCIREDTEYIDDFTDEFGQMRVLLNLDFLPNDEYTTFSAREVIPHYDEIVKNAEPEDIFIFRMMQSVVRRYGYSVIKAKHYATNEIKIFGQFAESFTNMIESILRNRRLDQANRQLSEMYDRMSEIYIRDMMTGLYNRTGYYRELEDYLEREDIKKGYLHIISIDMDGMKQINDNYGHQEGDVAIKAVAKALNDCFAQPCICARFGGDEFMVSLFTDSSDRPAAAQVSERINNYLSTMPLLHNKKYNVSVSVGHASMKVADIRNLSADVKNLEKEVDDDMYEDKRKRKAGRTV